MSGTSIIAQIFVPLNGTLLCFKMCAHVGTYFKVTTILQFYTFLYAPSI